MQNFDDFIYSESIGYLISMAGIQYKSKIWDCLKPYDLTPEQWVILNKLFDEDGISQRELAQRVVKNHPNTTRILDKMEQKGLIRRLADPHDRRAFQIYLTSAGAQIRDEVVPLLAEVYKLSIRGFNDQDIFTLKQLLARFSDNLT